MLTTYLAWRIGGAGTDINMKKGCVLSDGENQEVPGPGLGAATE